MNTLPSMPMGFDHIPNCEITYGHMFELVAVQQSDWTATIVADATCR